MMQSSVERRLWLYDAFMGMPAASVHDDDYSRSIQGQFVGSEAETRRILYRLGVPEGRYRIVRGWLEDTLPQSPSFPVALLHMDCEFYEPVKQVLEAFYDRVSPQGFVVLNDYGSFEGCQKAMNEFLSKLDAGIHLESIDHDAYYFQKP
jgi:O-methyltransferase